MWAAYGIFAARSVETATESMWVSRSAIAGMIIVFSGILYTLFIKYGKIRFRISS
jgi:hypothetical protein